MTQFFIAAGSFFALVGIIARSLSSHTLLPLLEKNGKLANFNLAADYLLFHALALIAVAILCKLYPQGTFHRAGLAFIVGSLLFQGSVLVKSFVSIQPFGFITPIGGFILIVGWFLLFVAAVRS
ncbi:MAG: DUF423 domain-containing protein [Desulforhopalus sp.]|nr:DUF423 domain-containing protein [Desulforhopalus sp.]